MYLGRGGMEKMTNIVSSIPLLGGIFFFCERIKKSSLSKHCILHYSHAIRAWELREDRVVFM